MALEKVKLNVEGMSCMHCVAAVKKAAGALEGVCDVQVSLESKTADVEFDSDKVALDAIKKAIEAQGYDVR